MRKKRQLTDRLMTLPDERYRSVVETQRFLLRLLTTPRLPKAIKQEAKALLRHYPTDWDMYRATQEAPDLFSAHMSPVHKFILDGDYTTRTDNDQTF